MALLNVLSLGTYTVVDQVLYSKQGQSVSFNLHIFSNADKQLTVASFRIDLSATNISTEVESRTVTSAPDNVPNDAYWLVPEDATGSWEQYKGKLVSKDLQGNHEWTYTTIADQVLWIKDEQKYIKVGATQEQCDFRGKREFDLHFNWSKIESQGLLACCYDYAKTLNLGENIKDG